MPTSYTFAELNAYLEEALPADRMAEIELAMRNESDLIEQLAEINARRDVGVHSLGAVWRRGGLTCFTRRELGNYVLGVLSQDEMDYLVFHLEQIGCRRCQANIDDLKRQQAESVEDATPRRRKYFQSSKGYLRQR